MSRIGTLEAYPCAVTRNAADILTDPPPEPADARLAYGPGALQFGDLRRAEGDGLAVVVHGGAWKAAYDLAHIEHLCVAFRDAGIATFNVEYRRVGDAGGGWPGSLEDVLRAVEYARRLAQRLVLVGHSAGGHLALLAAQRLRLPVVAIAAVSDPATWANDARAAFFGGEPPVRRIAARAGAARRSGRARARDRRRHRSVRAIGALRSRRRSGEAELIALEGAGHFEPIDPLSPELAVVRAAVERLLA